MVGTTVEGMHGTSDRLDDVRIVNKIHRHYTVANYMIPKAQQEIIKACQNVINGVEPRVDYNALQANKAYVPITAKNYAVGGLSQ